MINYQFNRDIRIDFHGIDIKPICSVAHSSHINKSRNPCEVLEQDSGRYERYLIVFRNSCIPPGHIFYITGIHQNAVFISEQVFQKYLYTKRKRININETRICNFFQIIVYNRTIRGVKN